MITALVSFQIPEWSKFLIFNKQIVMSDKDIHKSADEHTHKHLIAHDNQNDSIIKLQTHIQTLANSPSPVFSFFNKPVTNVLPKSNCSLVEVFHLIKGGIFSQQTTQLRGLSDSAAVRKFKAANFDYVTFSGIFSRRHNAGMVKHSGLMAIDFDHIENPASLKHRLLNDPYFDTELLFVSPSGRGLKWVIPSDLTQLSHQEYFKAVANYIKHTYSFDIDPSGKDVSRACFLSHDPQVFINLKYQ